MSTRTREKDRALAFGAIWCKAPRQRWHSRQSGHRGICKLQNPNGAVGFESHPLRQHASVFSTS